MFPYFFIIDIAVYNGIIANDAIRNNGLKIDGIWGDHLITNISCFESLNQVIDQGIKEFDYVIVSVKSYDTESIVSEYINKFSVLAPFISPRDTSATSPPRLFTIP